MFYTDVASCPTCQNQTGLNNLFKLVSSLTRTRTSTVILVWTTRCSRSIARALLLRPLVLVACTLATTGRTERKDQRLCLRLCEIQPARWLMCLVIAGTEIQWNNVPEQHELNKFVIQVFDEFGVKVISTDSLPHRVEGPRTIQASWLAWQGSSPVGWHRKRTASIGWRDWLRVVSKNGDEMWEAYKVFSRLRRWVWWRPCAA